MDRRYGCALLAGGAGSRMGYVNKANLIYRESTFADGIQKELEKTGMPCYLSAANYEQAVPARWKAVKDCVTAGDGRYTGPAGGIYSCLLKAGKDGLDGLFFVPCDAPLFTADVIEKMIPYIKEDYDALCWRTRDGRIQTTFGWYSVNCLDAFEEDIKAGKYKLLKLLEKVRLRVCDASAAGIDERQFVNINSEEDYRRVCQSQERKHILICGKRQSGKTTLINRIISESCLPVYGYRTQMERSREDGCCHVYMYPAGRMDGPRSRENEVGITGGNVKRVNSDVFNGLGCALLEAARDDGMIVMDEIGYMEDRAERFCRAVAAAFDGDIPVLASIKDTDHRSAHIQRILEHPKAQIFRLNPENREEIYEEIRSIVKTWEGIIDLSSPK